MIDDLRNMLLTEAERHDVLSCRLSAVKATVEEKRMNKHSELVKEAREMAGNCGPDSRWHVGHGAITDALRKLANIVEEHDKVPSFAENIKALRRDIDRLEWCSGGQAVNEELHAACKTCNEAIEAMVEGIGIGFVEPGSRLERELRAAGHLAKRAVEKAEKRKAVEDE